MNGVLGMAELLQDTDLTQKQLKFAKPIQDAGGTLLATINDILDVSKIEAGKQNAPGPRGRPLPRFNIDVLVAEDNYTNQEVALHNLRKFGCRVDMVSNGKEAVDAVDSKNYDLVFMDCQMPVMDGYRASAEIRRRETELAREHTVTIIAATANTMEDDKERCLAAGMDDYMSKPFHKRQLFSVLERWCEISSPGTTVQVPKENPVPPAAPTPQGPIDTRVFQGLRELQIKGDPDVVQRMVNAYLTTSKQLIAKMKQALSTKDFSSLQQNAHSLKSSSATLGAMELSEMYRQLELMSKQDAMAGAAHRIQTIEQEARKVNIALRKEAYPHDP